MDIFKKILTKFKDCSRFWCWLWKTNYWLSYQLPKFKNYIGIDASLNGYIVQNQLYNTFSMLNDYKFYDLLDFQSSNINIDKKIFSENKTIIHFPAWTNYDFIPNNSIDLILACHVHNELSRSDFLRLMQLVEKIKSKWYFYVRSELGIWEIQTMKIK